MLDFIRRSRLLAHLPGPKPRNWITGYMEIAYSKQPHRMCTALAEQYGPIFKFRILCFHVCFAPSSVDMFIASLP